MNNESKIDQASLLQDTALITNETNSNYTWNNFRGTLKTKSKYIYLRKIEVQNEK